MWAWEENHGHHLQICCVRLREPDCGKSCRLINVSGCLQTSRLMATWETLAVYRCRDRRRGRHRAQDAVLWSGLWPDVLRLQVSTLLRPAGMRSAKPSSWVILVWGQNVTSGCCFLHFLSQAWTSGRVWIRSRGGLAFHTPGGWWSWL